MIPVNRLLFVTALGLLPHLFVRNCFAQEPSKPPSQPSNRADAGDPTLKVVTLKHAYPDAVVWTLKNLGAPLSASAAGPQTVVLRGSPADIQKVIDTVIAAMDVPTVAGGSARSAEILPVRHYPIKEIGGLARNVAPTAPPTRWPASRPTKRSTRARTAKSCASGAHCTRSLPSCRASSRSPSPARVRTARPPTGTTSA